jgi:GNAT superfamily N-acetyltransferase
MQIRRFEDGDADAIAEIIRRCLREVNIRDYPAETIERMCAHYDAARLRELAEQREIVVAAAGDALLGTVSRDGYKVFTMFVDPDHAGEGIGRKLMNHLEEQVRNAGFDFVEAGASITAHAFYQKRGYIDVRETDTEFGLNYILRKPLFETEAAG